jgi:NADH-quinone oxidoreductase subunit E
MSAALLSPAAYEKIARELTKFPDNQKQSAVMAALAIGQREVGWMSPELIEDVARVLEMPPIAVHEVASFYTMYNKKPMGKFKLTVCTNLPCQLRNAESIVEYMQAKLGVGFNEVTQDGLFSMQEGECQGACADAPVMLVNNHRMCSFMNQSRVDALIAELKDSHERSPDRIGSHANEVTLTAAGSKANMGG